MDSAGDGDGLPLKVWEGRPGDLGLRCAEDGEGFMGMAFPHVKECLPRDCAELDNPSLHGDQLALMIFRLFRRNSTGEETPQ